MGRGGTHANFQNFEIAEFVTHYLSSFIQQVTGETGFHVVNKTGLSAKYDFKLKFDSVLDNSKIVLPRGRANTLPDATSTAQSASDPSGLPNLFKAIEQQLGLQLVKVKGVSLDVIVIDRLETAPIEN